MIYINMYIYDIYIYINMYIYIYSPMNHGIYDGLRWFYGDFMGFSGDLMEIPSGER